MKSRAAVLVAPGRIELREFPVPRSLPEGYGLLRVEGGGMCGTDVHQFHGRTGANGKRPPFPAILGHEPVGVIERLTPAAARAWGVAEGDRVAVEPTISCGQCSQCIDGRRQLCPLRSTYSSIPTEQAPSLWGAYADYLVLRPGTRVHRIPADVSIEDAVFFNPLAAGLAWTVDVGGLRMGDDALVIGPGQRGLASVVALREAGAARIIVAGRERDARKFAIARQLGATHVFEDVAVTEQVLEVTDGQGVHLALDCTPASDALHTAIASCRHGGTAVYVARHGQVSLDTDAILAKDLTIKCSLGAGSRAYAQAARIISDGKHELSALHTHRVSLDGVEHAIRMLAGESPGDDAIHVTVVP